MITFTKPIDQNKLRMAYNNDVVEFYSTSTTQPLYCDINIRELQLNIRLYPAPNGTFFFNFKEYVSAGINTRNFEDTLQTILQSPDPQTFIYNAGEGTCLLSEIYFTVWYSDTEYDEAIYLLYWLAGAEQLGDYNTFTITDTYILSPFKKQTANHYYLKYWQGYPFDIPIFSANGNLTLKNKTNGLSQEFILPGDISRLFLSDGRTDESLEDILPISEGYNSIRIMENEEENENDKILLLEKIPYQCGVYLKWLNKYGGYNYWLFEDTYIIDRSSKQLGELSRDNANLEDTLARAIQIGKESQDTIKIIAELITEEERRILEGLLDSPKIYLFTGQPYSRSSHTDWIEVSLKTSNARLKNAKQPLLNFSFDVELPIRYTQTL